MFKKKLTLSAMDCSSWMISSLLLNSEVNALYFFINNKFHNFRIFFNYVEMMLRDNLFSLFHVWLYAVILIALILQGSFFHIVLFVYSVF